mgnify:CR=1 FL=1
MNVRPNAKIVGGQRAIPNSWPATALIYFNYKTDTFLNNQNLSFEYSYQCPGTLISRKTVLFAAQCVQNEFYVVVNNIEYKLNITKNVYYPSFESMFKVYLGKLSEI